MAPSVLRVDYPPLWEVETKTASPGTTPPPPELDSQLRVKRKQLRTPVEMQRDEGLTGVGPKVMPHCHLKLKG